MIPQKIFIKQKVELIEALTNIETKNKYLVFDENQNKLFYAYEESNPILRILLHQLRPLKLKIVEFKNDQDSDNESNINNSSVFLELEKKFAFFFYKFFIYKNGELIGSIKTKYSFLHQLIYIYDKEEQLVFFTKSSILHPWTFKIFPNREEYDKNYKNEGTELALILKKWNGLGKEAFTDADTFYVDFKNLNDYGKELILATAFAVDLLFFEK